MLKQRLFFAFFLLLSFILQAQPNFEWANAMGASGADQSKDVVVDASGNVYTTGYFSGTVDFDPSAGVYNLTSAGGQDIFISKVDAFGNFMWAKQMRGAGNDVGNSIEVDASGNVYTTGYFQSTVDFDPGATTYTFTSAGGQDIFISKLDALGNFVWAKQIGDIGTDTGNSIAIDVSGNVYTTGAFVATVDFDPGATTYMLSSAGSFDIFISKLDPSGNFVWAGKMGTTVSDIGQTITLDAAGNVYTTGYFSNGTVVDFDLGAGVYNLTSAGGQDIFISKLDASGNFVWAKQMGGTLNDVGNDITLDAAGNVYTTGYFSGTADFDPSAGLYNLTSAGSQDIFISKLDASGNFVWAKQMGSTSNDQSLGIGIPNKKWTKFS